MCCCRADSLVNSHKTHVLCRVLGPPLWQTATIYQSRSLYLANSITIFIKLYNFSFIVTHRIGSKVSIQFCLLKRVLIFLRVLSSKWYFLHYIWSESPSAYLCIYVCIPNAQSLVFCILLLLFKSRKTPLRFSSMIRSEMAIRLLLIG